MFENPRPPLARALAIAVGIAAASALHYLTPPSLLLWHNIFQRLYYLPIVYAAVFFGWRGGLVASAVSAVCYLPHILLVWHGTPDYAMHQYAEIIIFFLVGMVTGVLADRERSQKRKLEAATEQLTKVYRDLQDSFEQLKRADRLSAIGQLSASLAHEIRNPLASIEGSAEVLRDPAASLELRDELLAIISKETRRLNRLLGNLLDFARPRRPEFQHINPEQTVDGVISLVEHTAQQSGIRLHKQVLTPVPAIESDPEQLKQVILNLTINAIQAMPHGGEIELALWQKDSSVVIAVKDQGGGIASEDLDKIFDPFYTTKDSGTGLGLSVAHQIVAQHRGAITAERNHDRGMTFSVTLPIQNRRET